MFILQPCSSYLELSIYILNIHLLSLLHLQNNEFLFHWQVSDAHQEVVLLRNLLRTTKTWM